MKKQCIYIFLLLLSIQSVKGQSPQANLDKYWHYRYRFMHYFEHVGLGPGESCPATVRNYEPTYGSANALTWADGPVTLGYYIGVLATEYRLLQDNGQNTEQTLWELYCALHAVYRLDSSGYATTYGLTAPSFPGNGYCLRDDVDPLGFYSNYSTDLNDAITSCSPPNNCNLGLTTFCPGSGQVGMVNAMYSEQAISGDDASYDNYIELLMGLALVVKYVDNVSTFTNPSTGNPVTSPYGDLHTMGLQLGQSIIGYMVAGIPSYVHDYQLIEPNGTIISNGGGGDAIPWEIPICGLADNIFGENLSPNITIPPNSETLEILSWEIIANCPIYNDNNNDKLGVASAAVSNSGNI